MIYFIVIIVFLVFFGIVINNQIIAKKNRADQAFSSIDVYLKKRFDLIPNLISVVKKYASHEKEILLKATELRTKIKPNLDQEEKVDASNDLSKLISKINVNVENYPNLKADEQFIKLQYSLNDIEEQLSAARRAYNAGVVDYNNKIQMIPFSIVAKIRGDQDLMLLSTPVAEQQNIDAKQLIN